MLPLQRISSKVYTALKRLKALTYYQKISTFRVHYYFEIVLLCSFVKKKKKNIYIYIYIVQIKHKLIKKTICVPQEVPFRYTILR